MMSRFELRAMSCVNAFSVMKVLLITVVWRLIGLQSSETFAEASDQKVAVLVSICYRQSGTLTSGPLVSEQFGQILNLFSRYTAQSDDRGSTPAGVDLFTSSCLKFGTVFY